MRLGESLLKAFPKGLAAMAAGLLLLWAAVATTASPADASQTATVTVRNSEELVVVVRRLIQAGEYDAARQVIRAWQPGDATYSYRVSYVEGLIEKARGNYPQAIAIFRGILAKRPDFTFVRLDLTDTLYLAKDDDAAKYQANLLIASGVDDQIGGGLKTIVGDIDARRPVRFRGFVSLLPSTNLNGGTSNEFIDVGGLPFEIDAAAREKSGIGFLAGGDVLLRHQLTDQYAAVGSASLVARMYPSIDRVDLAANLSAGIERKFDRGIMTLSAIAEQDFSGLQGFRDIAELDGDFRAYGGQLENSWFLGGSSRVYGRVALTEREYRDNDAKDGWRAEFSGSYDYFTGPARFYRVLGGAIHEKAEDDVFSFTEVSGGLGFSSEFGMGITAYAQGVYAHRQYEDPLPVFGVREDNRIEAQLTLTKRDLVFYGLAPQVTYSFVRNDSTSPFDEFTTHGIDLRLVKNF